MSSSHSCLPLSQAIEEYQVLKQENDVLCKRMSVLQECIYNRLYGAFKKDKSGFRSGGTTRMPADRFCLVKANETIYRATFWPGEPESGVIIEPISVLTID